MAKSFCEEHKQKELIIADKAKDLHGKDEQHTNFTAGPNKKSMENDDKLLEDADRLYKEQKILSAARVLRQVQNKTKFANLHDAILQNADICQRAVYELLEPVSAGWKKQGEAYGKYKSIIYYKAEEGAKMTCRIETPIPPNLLVPLLSVLNESSLYKTWVPSWKKPVKLGLCKSDQLVQDTRGHQIIQLQGNVPWPFKIREALLDGLAVDDIDEQGFVIVKIRSLVPDDVLPEGFSLPPLDGRRVDRMDFDGAVLFRPCPKDHPALSPGDDSDENLLVQFTCHFDAHIPVLPPSAINFISRTVIGRVWNMFLQVAQDVRDGSSHRHGHQNIIREKQEFYSWLEERARIMISNRNNTNNNSNASTGMPINHEDEITTSANHNQVPLTLVGVGAS